ncbi:MAG: glycosyltransferase [Chryseobacterium sp.]|uniref:glycosyltransferase n=1 Tax=Chryseobacterium sp. TaxID=1871047 RepID=UPI001B2E916C|nr:glycosyltransferase [Chryseobacterium sp.]MBO6185069.1 glycosyltransferase [Chryseobacterium sp.]
MKRSNSKAMKNKTAFILNYAPHYRLFIYKKINDELNVDFYFGNIPNSSIKKLDYKNLSNFKEEFKTLKLLSFLWYKNSVRLIFKSYKNYILTGDPYILSNWIILVLAKLFNKKTVLWTHGWYGRETITKKVVKKMYFGLADKILLYNEKSKSLMLDEGFQEKKLIPIYNSLDYDTQKVIRDGLQEKGIYFNYFKNNCPVLIYIGRIQKTKKIDLLLKSLYEFKLQNIIYNLIIVGGNSDEFNANEIIKNLEIEDQVWLYGPSYDEEKNAELIFNANLCVSPGNVGLTAIHSLMYGTPVLTHNNFKNQGPEWECIIEGVNGGFFKENDVDDLMSKIKYYIQHPINKEQCYKVIEEKWNPHNQINILKDVLNESSN